MASDPATDVVRALDGKLMPSKWLVLAQALRAAVRLLSLEREKRLYCCLFPSNYEFERETLVQLWMSLLQHPTERIEDKRFELFLNRDKCIFKSRTDILTGRDMYKIDVNKVKTDLNELKARSLYAMIDDENTGMYSSTTSWHHVSIVSKDIKEKVFETLRRHSELKSVLFIPDYGSSLKQIPSSFFTALPHMQALDLSGTHISELPSSIGEMTHLHYLDLSSTLIERLPESICQLQELQTLRLRECKRLHALPKGMKALVNLYHLDFDVLGQLSSMPKGLGCLTKLRTLSAFMVSKEDGCSLRELKGMKKLRGNLCISGLEHATSKDALEAEIKKKSGIKRLHLKWDYSKYYEDDDRKCAISVLEELQPCESLKELQISYYPGSEHPSWMGDASLYVHSIAFLRCNFETIPILRNLKNLKLLKIFDLSKVTHMDTLSDGHGGRYDKLETLVIDGMRSLKSWHKVEDGDYPCLSKLIISNCPELRELPRPLFSSLKYLNISDCKSLQSLPVEDLPRSLDTLMISNCPSLKCDWTKIEDREDLNKWIDTKDEDKGPFKEVSKGAKAVRAYFDRKRLLYCCLFPSNYEFERETLVQLWMGLLQQPLECIEDQRFDRFLKIGKYIFEARKDFLTGRKKYKIDVNKVTTLSKEFKDRNLYAMIDDENTGMDSSTSWHHVSILRKNIDEKVFQTLKGHRELRSVLFIPDYGSSLKQIPSSFFTALPYMQELDLSGSHISELPSTVEYMTHLHYLDLSFTLIERLPESIGKLQELQTLRLRECKHLHALPKGMKLLVNLRHLDFDVLGQLGSMPKGLGCLTKLRTLSAFIVSEDGCSLGELKDMDNLCGSFCISRLEHATSKHALEAEIKKKSGIKQLHLKWDYSKYYNDDDQQCAISVLKELKPCESLKELQISYYPGSEHPSWMGDASLYVHVHSITLLNCDFERLPDLGGLKNLKHLKIFNLNRVIKMDGRGGRYEKLETLAIDGMLRLESWKVQDGDYPCLFKLTISRCSKLRQLPPNFARLPSLKYLELSHCKSLQSLDLPGDECFQSSLNTLMIINCPSLKKRCSNGGDDWRKIEKVQNIWVDMKDVKYIKDKDKDKDASSEDELIYYDELDEECGETPSTSSAEMLSTSAETPSTCV